MNKIKLTENIGVSGKSKTIGDILTIGEDISQEEARYIVSIKRAIYFKDEKLPLVNPLKKDLKKLNIEALREIAKDYEITDFDKLNKEQLIEVLTEAESLMSELKELEVKDIQKLAKDYNIPDFEKLNKEQLIKAILKADRENKE